MFRASKDSSFPVICLWPKIFDFRFAEPMLVNLIIFIVNGSHFDYVSRFLSIFDLLSNIFGNFTIVPDYS